MKQSILLITVSCLNIALIVLIIKHTCYAEPDEQNCLMEQQAHVKQQPATFNMATLQQLHQLFNTSDKTDIEVHDALSLYAHTVQAMPKIATTLERLGNSYAKLAYHDQAYTAYATAHSLNPSSPHSFILFNYKTRHPFCTHLA